MENEEKSLKKSSRNCKENEKIRRPLGRTCVDPLEEGRVYPTPSLLDVSSARWQRNHKNKINRFMRVWTFFSLKALALCIEARNGVKSDSVSPYVVHPRKKTLAFYLEARIGAKIASVSPYAVHLHRKR